MGEVYRARDSKLKRDVAIKILPEPLAGDPERVSRFEREAEALASLSHGNIATIYDFDQSAGRHFLVMELVEGDTLADRLAGGPLPIDEALEKGAQIARALEAAHQKGIVHRDLKPGNIKVANGTVKVLDFGLAKWFEEGAASLDPANSPTTLGGTSAGLILGTAAYMSPEQARGAAVDKRTDVWALGCILYEMLTGTRAFGGDNVSDIVASVLRGEPDWGRLPDETPPRIRLLLQRCLRKDPRQRVHDAADVRIELEDAAADAQEGTTTPTSSRAARLALIALGLAGGAVIASALWAVADRGSGETAYPIHLSVTSPSMTSSALYLNANHQVDISPDGKAIVYVGKRGATRQLFLRRIGEADGRPVDGTQGVRTAFFSPDSRWIAFANERSLQKVAASGGSPIAICELSSTGFYSGAWSADNTIVFVPDYSAGLWSVSADGGTPRPLLETAPEHDRVVYVDPEVLPDGKGVLFTMASGRAIVADDQDIAVLPRGAREPQVLVRGGSNGRYLPTGQIVYVRGGALLSVAFDLSTLKVTGTPITVLEGLARTWSGDANYSVSANGTLVYEAGSGMTPGSVLLMADRQGRTRRISKPSNLGEFSISPDGRSIAARLFAVNDDIWIYDVATGTPVRLTSEPRDEIFPAWSPDGKRIAFGNRTGSIFWQPADGSAPREQLSQGQYPRYPTSFSPDGKSLAFVEQHPSRQRDIWVMALDGNRASRPLVMSEADESGGKFSPDGRWLAYVSNETGRDEIFVRPVGAAGGRKRLSSEGGVAPVWAPGGRELFFMKDDKLCVVGVDADGNAVGRDRVVMTVPSVEHLEFDPGTSGYDIMPDGEHFVFSVGPSPSTPTHYDVVLNWFKELTSRPGR
jgi:eukaryotic-like serine/threonine-protein kinase